MSRHRYRLNQNQTDKEETLFTGPRDEFKDGTPSCKDVATGILIESFSDYTISTGSKISHGSLVRLGRPWSGLKKEGISQLTSLEKYSGIHSRLSLFRRIVLIPRTRKPCEEVRRM